ncbi:MAG: DnaJ domain-containing protein [Acidobacteriia bacterium]|nr:DnaJ domain-containing protein [Terriglobia bacterium]
MSKDLYKILGIPRKAEEKEIRAAYRTLAKKYHPDTGAGSSEEKFREIQIAYEILSDPARRAAYDSERSRQTPVPAPAERIWYTGRQQRARGMDPSHLDLSDIFSRSGPGSAGPRRAPTQQFNPWADWEEILRVFRRFDDFDW